MQARYLLLTVAELLAVSSACSTAPNVVTYIICPSTKNAGDLVCGSASLQAGICPGNGGAASQFWLSSGDTRCDYPRSTVFSTTTFYVTTVVTPTQEVSTKVVTVGPSTVTATTR